MEAGTKAVGLFNRGDKETTMTARWSDLGINGAQIVRDAWRQQDLGRYDGEFKTTVRPHGVILVRLRHVKDSFH
jgi:alpha-galactosidase